MPGNLPGNSGTDSIKTQVRDSFEALIDRETGGLGFAVFPPLGSLPT